MLDRLLSDLRRDEGVRYSAYQDSLGYWTVGVGHLIDARRGGKISDAVVNIMLSEDATAALSDLDRNASWWRTLSENRQCALANMCFALGWPTLSKFTDMLGALKSGDWQRAHDEALHSKWADETDGKLDGQDGQRAIRIAQLYLEG